MPFVLADRVQETTTSTGTGTVTLAGAVAGFQSFSAIGNGNTTYYAIVHTTQNEWEVGLGTYTLSTTSLSRTTVIASTNSGNPVSFSAGTKNVFCTYPAGRSVQKDSANILTLDAGTSTIPPLVFQSGTNLATASAGSMEYNGTTLFFTPSGLQRGVVTSEQLYRLNAANTLANSNATQNILGVGVTLATDTQYQFEAMYYLFKSAGSTSHDHDFGFGGTATVNNIFFEQFMSSLNASTTLPYREGGVVSAASNTASVTLTMSIGITQVSAVRSHFQRGTVSIGTGGTFIPQIKFSAAPGGTWSVGIGSYFRISPIGAAGANVNIGTWA